MLWFSVCPHNVRYVPLELSEYVIQQDEEGETLLGTICNLKDQLVSAKDQVSKLEKVARNSTSMIPPPPPPGPPPSSAVTNGPTQQQQKQDKEVNVVELLQGSQD